MSKPHEFLPKPVRVLYCSPQAYGKNFYQCMRILNETIRKEALKIELVDATAEGEAYDRGYKDALASRRFFIDDD